MRPCHRLIAVTLLGLGAIVGYSFATRTSDESSNSADVSGALRQAEQPIEDPATPVKNEAVADAASPGNVASPESVSPETLAQWILDTRSADERKRIAAIVALGQAPKAEAVPALQRVLENGEHERDRQIALRSLHTLAIQQGDDDQRIRDTFRSAIYHGDDEGLAQSAQAFLEDVEEVLTAGESQQLAR
jgi:HEAT repeat protein